MAAAEAKADDNNERFIIFQLGTNNWQVKDEPTSGSGILHEAHHLAYNKMPNTVCYSIWPSGNKAQTTESFQNTFDKNDPLRELTRVYALDGSIPVCESNHPGSHRRWHAMTPEERGKYYNECFDMVYNFLIDIETKLENGKEISLIIVHHTFLNPVIMHNVLLKRKENKLSIPPVAVFIHGTGLKMYQHELREERDNVDEKDREFTLKNTPIKGLTPDNGKDGKGIPYKTFLEWIDGDMKLFSCDNEFKPCVGYAISHKTQAAYESIFKNFPKDRIVVSPNGVDTDVFKVHNVTINDVLKDLMTFPAKKDVKPTAIPLKSPNGKEWSHLIVHVSKMADWKRPDSVMYGFVDLLKVYPDALLLMIGQGTPEVNLKYQTLCEDELKLDKSCFFIGQKMLSELALFYSAASVGVFPSKDEPFGMVFIECMVCGTPVIGANSGGPKDFLIKSDKYNDTGLWTTGILVEESNDNKEVGKNLGKYLIQSIKDDWKKIMNKDCLGFKEKFTVDTQCENLLKDTKKILAANAAKGKGNKL